MNRSSKIVFPSSTIIAIVFSLVPLTIFSIIISHEVNGEITSSNTFHDEVLDFLQKNGKKYLTFASLDTEDNLVKEKLKTLVRKSKIKPNLRSRLLPSENIDTMHRFHQDTLVLVTSSKSQNWKKYLDIISSTKIMSSVVVCIGELQRQRFEELNLSLQEDSINTFFYWIGIEGKNLKIMDWKQIISLKNSKQSVATSMNFDSVGRIIPEKNMQGMHINCSTLSWLPYFELSDCKGINNTNCSGVGYFADVMNILGARFNFTWSCDAEPNGNWGIEQPISGPRNASGSWGGVFGLVANGSYPLSSMSVRR